MNDYCPECNPKQAVIESLKLELAWDLSVKREVVELRQAREEIRRILSPWLQP